jgi:DNA helicase-2/ATP-dependent DNA helicase PcrA
MRLVDNPRSDADLLRIINVPTRGLGSKTIERITDTASIRSMSAYDAIGPTLQYSDIGTAAKKKLQAFSELIQELRHAASTLSPKELAERVLEASGYRAMLQSTDTAESDARLGNIEELLGSIAEYETDCLEAGQIPSLTGYLERVTLVSAVDALENTPTVSLMTVHSAKGLEFDTVFLTGMEEEVFPYRGVDAESPAELEEERRLAYVALTRARRRLFVTHAGSRTLFGQTRYLAPSRFLSDLPDEVVDRLGSASGSSWGAAGYGRAGNGSRSPLRPSAPPRSFPERESFERRVVDRQMFDDVAHEADERGLRPGDRVYHQRFGQGTVEEVDVRAASVVARFPGYGQKRILAQYLTRGA